jgi:hypothetical protein
MIRNDITKMEARSKTGNGWYHCSTTPATNGNRRRRAGSFCQAKVLTTAMTKR